MSPIVWFVLLLISAAPGSFSMVKRVRVVSYNVLSSHLASPSHFTSCQPTYLDASYRYKKLCEKLDRETEKKSVICLQEVSTEWAGLLHVYFFAKKYHLITALYGGKFGGYMGVATAVPIDSFDIQTVNIKRISDTISIPPVPSPSFFQRIISFFQRLLLWKPVETSWDRSLCRNNELIAVTLTPRESGSKFTIANYHMPCDFRNPMVMVTHSCLAAQYLQGLSPGSPHILAGDFNFMPSSTMYRILTEGEVERENPDLPLEPKGVPWKPVVAPLRSAYKIATGCEPDFTNHAQIKDQEPFVETLDYIFMSPEWVVDSVDQLPHRSSVVGPFPVASEPSDHILIAADLSLPES
jgi:2',5'-phosphodiesterase